MSRFDITEAEWPNGDKGPLRACVLRYENPVGERGLYSVVPAAAYTELLEVATEMAEAIDGFLGADIRRICRERRQG